MQLMPVVSHTFVDVLFATTKPNFEACTQNPVVRADFDRVVGSTVVDRANPLGVDEDMVKLSC